MARASQERPRGESIAVVWRLRCRRALKLGLVVMVFSFGYGVGTSSYFAIREVEIIAPGPQLAQQALVQIEVPGEASALFYPVQRLARTVQESPYIKRAKVERDLPAKLVVQVWPRVPVAAVRCGGQFSLVDEEGVCVRQTADAAQHLIRIYGLVSETLAPGERLKPDCLNLLTSCLAAVADAQVRAGLQIDFSQRYAIEACTADGVRSKLGTADNLQRKVMMFAAILDQLQRRGHDPEYIDVRIMHRPVWKPRRPS